MIGAMAQRVLSRSDIVLLAAGAGTVRVAGVARTMMRP
jgi:hypothetical protein